MVNDVLLKHDLNRKLAQVPVTLFPTGFGLLGGRSVGVRAFITRDFMTGTPACPGVDLPLEAVDEMCNGVLGIEGVARIAFDISPKPPATTEWGAARGYPAATCERREWWESHAGTPSRELCDVQLVVPLPTRRDRLSQERYVRMSIGCFEGRGTRVSIRSAPCQYAWRWLLHARTPWVIAWRVWPSSVCPARTYRTVSWRDRRSIRSHGCRGGSDSACHQTRV